MRVKLIENGEVIVVDETYGERLVEQGKAVPAGLMTKPAKAEVSVTDKVPEDAKAEEGTKTETAKKAGKKR